MHLLLLPLHTNPKWKTTRTAILHPHCTQLPWQLTTHTKLCRTCYQTTMMRWWQCCWADLGAMVSVFNSLISPPLCSECMHTHTHSDMILVTYMYPGERVREIMCIKCDLTVFRAISFDHAYSCNIALTHDYSWALRTLREIAVNCVHLIDTYIDIHASLTAH